MAGDPKDIPKLTGISKYFNSYTEFGRSNVVFTVWGTCILLFLYSKFKPSKKE